MSDWRWTGKLPAVVIGAVLAATGWMLARHGGRWALLGICLLVAGTATLIYSTTIHEWCAPITGKFGTAAFGGGLFHAPSVWDCYSLVRGYHR